MPSVEIYLDDFTDEELIEEIYYRGLASKFDPINSESELFQIIRQIYENRRLDKEYQDLLDKLIFEVIGRIE